MHAKSYFINCMRLCIHSVTLVIIYSSYLYTVRVNMPGVEMNNSHAGFCFLIFSYAIHYYYYGYYRNVRSSG